eukprot:1924428-Pleurochrysis_carterae.AAC.1
MHAKACKSKGQGRRPCAALPHAEVRNLYRQGGRRLPPRCCTQKRAIIKGMSGERALRCHTHKCQKTRMIGRKAYLHFKKYFLKQRRAGATRSDKVGSNGNCPHGPISCG